jgi:hypothetical protein
LPAHQIGDDYVSSRRTNIDTHDATLARVDKEERGPPASSNRFAHRAFKDQRLTEEFANKQTRDAAPNVHEPREVSTRNGLVGTDEIQDNLPVNFTARPATRDLEIVWVNLTHGANCSELRLIKPTTYKRKEKSVLLRFIGKTGTNEFV